MNSVAASRERLPELFELVEAYDTLVVVMASERFTGNGTAQCLGPDDVHEAVCQFVELLATKAGRTNDRIIVDPGLAPVGADTYGLVNIGLDAMRLIRSDKDLAGVHLSVGLSNFAWGTPRHIRPLLERAYLTVGVEAGLDFAIANPESAQAPLPEGHQLVTLLREALAQGRAGPGEDRETAGFRQAEAVLRIWEMA